MNRRRPSSYNGDRLETFSRQFRSLLVALHSSPDQSLFGLVSMSQIRKMRSRRVGAIPRHRQNLRDHLPKCTSNREQ